MMSSNRYILHALKYSMLTMLVLGVVVTVTALVDSNATGNIAGRLVQPQTQGTTPIVNIGSAQIAQGGASVPADTHVILSIPRGLNVPIMTFFGGPDYDQNRFWMYCYSGNEKKNKELGLSGSKQFDGRFYYSGAEAKFMNQPIEAGDSDLLALRNRAQGQVRQVRGSQIAYFTGGETCYVMSSAILYASPDSDEDGIPDKRENDLGTNPNGGDTDGEGLNDGRELFQTKTDIRNPDTDGDGLNDYIEVSTGTSPKDPDSDKDGLCDGNGNGGGCPEERRQVCTLPTDPGGRVCYEAISSPVQGEDMNQNGKWDCADTKAKNCETDPRKSETFQSMTDYQFKLNQL
jgi:Bacterial TSP3 repeat